MRRLIYAVLLSLCSCSTASFKYGVGLNDGEFPDTAVKTLGIAGQGALDDLLDFQSSMGLFINNRSGLGPTYYLTPFSLGLKTKGPGLFASYFVGPSLITQTDQRLSSILEFENNFEVGIRDYRGASLGLNLQHFSNAGFWLPNFGRDFFTIILTIPF